MTSVDRKYNEKVSKSRRSKKSLQWVKYNLTQALQCNSDFQVIKVCLPGVKVNSKNDGVEFSLKLLINNVCYYHRSVMFFEKYMIGEEISTVHI